MGDDRADLRRALFSLALHSRHDAGVTRAELERAFPASRALDLSEALEVLANAPGRIPRVVVHESMRRLHDRRGPGVFAPAKVNTALNHALGAHGLNHPAVSPVGNGRWERPTCTDKEVTSLKGLAATSVTLELRTSRSVHQMAPYADPTHWPRCSAFFVAMDAVSVARSTSAPTQNWAGAFEEVVEVIPGYPMTTPLRFDYHYDTAHDVVTLTYVLLEATDYLDVDEGSIVIEPDDTAPPYQTKVTAVKTIHWSDPLMQIWPSLACDTFWGELGLIMAAECGNGI